MKKGVGDSVPLCFGFSQTFYEEKSAAAMVMLIVDYGKPNTFDNVN